MALIVEDGSGVDGADSFASLVDARTIATNYGLSLDADDTLAEIQLRKAYLGLQSSEKDLQGSRTHAIQTGIFPREGVYSNCVEVDSESIPSAAIMAQVSFADAINRGYETNEIDNGQNLSGFSAVNGVYSETYQDGSTTKTNSTIQGVYNSLYPFTLQGYAASPCGRAAGFGGLYKEDPFA